MIGWDELGDGIFRRRYRELDQNIGLVVGSEDLVVVDSRSHPEHGRVLREHISQISKLPIRWMINTHWHWDHCFGNAAFPDAVFVGHRRCRSGLIERGRLQLDMLRTGDWFEESERGWLDEVEIIPPTLTFDHETPLWAAGRRIDLSHHGRGHTDADIVVTVDDVSFVGDLVEEGNPPAFDDGYPSEWVATLRAALPRLRPVVVPGHGDVVDRNFVTEQARQIESAVDGTGAPFPAAVMEVITRRLEIERRGRPDLSTD